MPETFKSLIVKGICWPLGLMPKRLKVPIVCGKLRGSRWIVGAGNHKCWIGIYENEKQKWFERIIRPRSIVYDLGAHSGFYSLLASVLVGPNGYVYAFEPLPENLFYLREHLVQNRICNTQVLDYAVSDHNGTMKFLQSQESYMGRLDSAGDMEVMSVSLDRLVAEGKIKAPDFIKIDIEGSEYAALKGAKNILLRYHPTIFLSTHGADIHGHCIALLNNFGYVIKPIGNKELCKSDELIAF